jgi:DNA mismatch endonuclease (patch repair protein)
MMVRRLLFRIGYHYMIHFKGLPGRPDIVMLGRKDAIFVHDCFWHCHENCRYFRLPSSNTEFWRDKHSANVGRDRKTLTLLGGAGWRVLTVWECSTRSEEALQSLNGFLEKLLEGSLRLGEWPRAGRQFQVTGFLPSRVATADPNCLAR